MADSYFISFDSNNELCHWFQLIWFGSLLDISIHGKSIGTWVDFRLFGKKWQGSGLSGKPFKKIKANSMNTDYIYFCSFSNYLIWFISSYSLLCIKINQRDVLDIGKRDNNGILSTGIKKDFTERAKIMQMYLEINISLSCLFGILCIKFRCLCNLFEAMIRLSPRHI